MTNKKKKFYIIILSILNVFRSIFLVSQALASKKLIDVATNKSNKNDLLFWIIIFALLIILNIVTSLLFLGIRNKFSLLVEVDMKNNIYQKLIKKDIEQTRKIHSGEITNIYLSDIQNIRVGLCETIPNFFLYSSRFILSFIALIYFDYRLLIILLILGIFALISAKIYSKIIKKYQKQSLESDGKVNAFMQESFENIKIVKALSAEKNMCSSLDNKLIENKKIKSKRNHISLIGNGGVYVLMEITVAFTMIYGGISIYQGLLTYGSLVGLLQIVSYFETPLSMFSSLMTRFNAYKVSEERINNLYKIPDDYEQIKLNDFDKIVFNNVSFSYDQDILKNYNLVINKNDTILLKGHSGCGKSTMFNLILGFISPQEGSIDIYSNNHVYPSKQCRELFSYVSQENILFSGTIEDNIKLFVPNYNEKELINALKLACIYDEIMEKPLKMKTIINERGNGLSLGQIQRVLLAISILQNKPILLLDEFTSALDKELEKRIVINVSKLNKTKIIITHRDISLSEARTIVLGE